MTDGWCPTCDARTGFVGICHACAYKFAGPEGLYPPKIVAAVRRWMSGEESLTDSPNHVYVVNRFSHHRSPRMDLKITLVIDLSDRLASSLSALLSGGERPTLTPASQPAASAAEPASSTTAGATPATETTSEPSKTGRRGAKKTEPAASTPASGTSPGDVFSNPGASAQTPANPALTGDVFSQQIATANAEAAAPAAAAALAAENPAFTTKEVGDRVSALLPSLGAKGLKGVLSGFQTASGEAVTVLRDLQPGDYAAFMEELSVYG